MPTHFHWLLEVNPLYGTLSDVMRDIKKYSAWDIMDELHQTGDRGYLKRFAKAAAQAAGQKRKFWMKRFDDAYIRNDAMFGSRLDYIHSNPVKAGLVDLPENYIYSSARNYILRDHSVLDVATDW
jgi:REP element-mobilizing transposase RayT